MEIKITTSQILKSLHLFSWIIFIALCIEAGALLFNTIYTFVYSPAAAKFFYKQLNFENLLQSNPSYFITLLSIMLIIATLKAILFYLIIWYFSKTKQMHSKPFTIYLYQFVKNSSLCSLGIALFSNWGTKFSSFLTKNNYIIPNLEQLNFSGASIWLFFALFLFVISQVLKKGIEIQEENELTI